MDAFASTGQGLLGYNMFAYCNNNPINFLDSCGTHPMIKNTVFINDGASLDYEEYIEQFEVKYYPNSSGNGGKIENSYRITDTNEMTQYVTYLATASQHKDTISGSIEGVVFEWWVHNIIYDIASEVGWERRANQAKDVDIGKTIYDDNHGFISKIMWVLYEIAWPEQAANDKAIHDEERG